jgi:1-acyl-sn-glycerol-3-phosphate acyltransferase
MKLPPRLVRRLIIDPAFVVGLGLAFLALPIWLLAALIASLILPGTFRVVRIAWFLFLYLAVEVVALMALFLLWIASGFGWKIRTASFQHAHYRLLGLILRLIVGAAKRAFNLRVELQAPPAQTVGDADRRPALMFSRHAGPGDSMLLLDFLVNGYKREPRIVLKEFLQWDPMVDVVLNRLPTAFVPVGRKGGEALITAIRDLARSMGQDDAFVIFPEGANYTKGRHLKAIRKLREMGRPDLAERAENLKHTLPPRTTGVQAVLETAPANADVFFVGHAGLEGFESVGDIWRGMPMDTVVEAKTWIVPAENIPEPGAQEAWLYETWAEIDAWIVDELAETAEPE